MSKFWSHFKNFQKILKQQRNFWHIFKKNDKWSLALTKRYSYFVNLATLFDYAVVVAVMDPEKSEGAVNKIKINAALDSKASHCLRILKERWMTLYNIPGIFAYQLSNNRMECRLPGRWGFWTELNSDRSFKRRAPQSIESLKPTFKPQQFNFNKVKGQEVILIIDDERNKVEIRLIINKSPLTQYHSVICPDVHKNLVQRLTATSINFCVNFMRNIDDPGMRMGYNSPGALASVNHLHIHLLKLPQELYIDQVELEELAGGYAYRLAPESPTEAICFIISGKDTEEQVRHKVNRVYEFTEWLCNNNLPHNMFITRQRAGGDGAEDVRLFVFVREKFCVAKDLAAFNVGFCELVGFIPLADEDKLNNLTAEVVEERIRHVSGAAYERVYPQVKSIINGTTFSPWQLPFCI